VQCALISNRLTKERHSEERKHYDLNFSQVIKHVPTASFGKQLKLIDHKDITPGP